MFIILINVSIFLSSLNICFLYNFIKIILTCILYRLLVDFFFFFFKLYNFYLFIYLFMAVLGLRFCARAFSSCGKRGPLFIAVRGPLTITASLVVEHRLQTRRLSNCGSRAQLLRGMWDLPRPGLEPVSPASAGGFSTTAPRGKPLLVDFVVIISTVNFHREEFTCTCSFWIRTVYVCVCVHVYVLVFSSFSLCGHHSLSNWFKITHINNPQT